MPPRKQQITNGDEQEVGLVEDVYFDRAYRPMWNRWGDRHMLPADPVSLSDWLQQGWTTREPEHPEARPRGKLMRDGTTFMFDQTSQPVSEVERARMNRTQDGMALAAGPTAMYYSQSGDAFGPWPADPESIKGYMEIGLTLAPPARTAGRPRKLRAV